MRSAHLSKGLTLVELIVTITVLAILVTVGIPQFQGLVQGNRATSAANELLGSLQFARSEAVKRSRPVTICPSSDQATCSGSDWSVGWIIREDPSTLIRVTAPLPNNVQVTSADNAVTFNAVGTANSTTFTVAAGSASRTVWVGVSGCSSTLEDC